MNKHEVQDKRRELADKLPTLSVRVFALKGRHYQGCGFHWCLVKDLGGLMLRLNDYDNPFSEENLLVLEVIYEDLLDRVGKAEAQLLPTT